MMIEIVVPQVGEAIAEVRLVRWLVSEGDEIQHGEVLFEVDTDKAVVEVESFAEGTLTEILVPDDSPVMPQQVVALLTPAGEAEIAPSRKAPPQSAAAQAVSPAPSGDSVSPVARRVAAELGVALDGITGTGPGGRVMVEDVRAHAARQIDGGLVSPVGDRREGVLASPKARRIARELGVSLGGLVATGVDGLIVARDVQAAPGETGVQPLSKLRHSIATRMLSSKQTVPHFYLMVDVDMTQVEGLRAYCLETLNWERAPTYTDLIVRACAVGLAANPAVNVIYSDEGLIRRTSVDIGVAVGVDDGLIVPVLPNADQLSLAETSEAIRGLVQRAHDGRLRAGDLSQKSMVVSNLGMYGVDAFVAIIDPPDPVILAVGRVADQIVPVDGQAAIRPMCTMTLSVDHRVLDGVIGAKFLARVKDALENPFELLG